MFRRLIQFLLAKLSKRRVRTKGAALANPDRTSLKVRTKQTAQQLWETEYRFKENPAVRAGTKRRNLREQS